MESTPPLFTSSPDGGWEGQNSQNDATPAEHERALVEAAQRERSAFAPLYQRYVGRVYSYLRARRQSEEDAADLTQQVFLQALDALPRYQPRGISFAAWLFAIARNLLADRFRRHPASAPLEAAGNLLSDQEIEAAMLQRETVERLSALLATLPPDARDLLALRFAAGLTTPEIAATLGKRPDAVRKSLSRLLQSLKEQYHVSE